MLIRCLAVVLLVCSLPVHAEWQNLEAIKSVAQEFVQRQTASLPGKTTIKIGTVDPRLKLKACSAMEAFLPPGARLWGNATIGVRCPLPENWSIYLQVNVQVVGKVLITAKPLPRGHILSEQDLASEETDLTELSTVLTTSGQALGQIVTVSLPAGARLQASMLRAPYAVRQGQVVKLIYQGNGFNVSAEGKALSNAAAGETVQVRTASGKITQGVARPGGTVEIR